MVCRVTMVFMLPSYYLQMLCSRHLNGSYQYFNPSSQSKTACEFFKSEIARLQKVIKELQLTNATEREAFVSARALLHQDKDRLCSENERLKKTIALMQLQLEHALKK